MNRQLVLGAVCGVFLFGCGSSVASIPEVAPVVAPEPQENPFLDGDDEGAEAADAPAEGAAPAEGDKPAEGADPAEGDKPAEGADKPPGEKPPAAGKAPAGKAPAAKPAAPKAPASKAPAGKAPAPAAAPKSGKSTAKDPGY